MVEYDLSHLNQDDSQEVWGPIQDDEALLLYAAVRCMRLRVVLEIGGLHGYSARNFCRAVGGQGRVYTVDINKVDPVADNHEVIRKSAEEVLARDLGGGSVDLVFYDCHDYAAQLTAHRNLEVEGVITPDTVVALHDTNLHPARLTEGSYRVPGGFVHQWAERSMVNRLRERGYDAFCLHTKRDVHHAGFPFRHGLTLMKRMAPLVV